ncbi:hypothetical protein K1719_026436 [Acacia pycnantha]|nr:hypothetical protein K1719_026436 [Acacia pycnantha]
MDFNAIGDPTNNLKGIRISSLDDDEEVLIDNEHEDYDFNDEEEEDPITLGFVGKPKNNWCLQRQYFPSKAGRGPAWLDPVNRLEGEQNPETRINETPILVAAKNGVMNPETRINETPILVAAKNGVMEIIEKIVELFPVAIYDQNEDKKNIVLLALEHRKPHVYQFLLKKNIYRKSLSHQLDEDGNSTLHLAATLGDYKPWLIPSEALQMQWELKWYNFVNKQTSPDFFFRYNKKNETLDVVFTRTHKDLTKWAAEWLTKTSESCSVVAALIAKVAFATAATVPSGVVQ